MSPICHTQLGQTGFCSRQQHAWLASTTKTDISLEAHPGSAYARLDTHLSDPLVIRLGDHEHRSHTTQPRPETTVADVPFEGGSRIVLDPAAFGDSASAGPSALTRVTDNASPFPWKPAQARAAAKYAAKHSLSGR